MPSEFIGSMVSIDCGQLGSYQGHVLKVDPVMNTLTISHAFHNGLRCDQPQVNLSSTTILDIKIIHSSTEAKEIIDRKTTPSKMTKEIDEVTKPTCSSPVKIIQAASKARSSGFSTTSSTTNSSIDQSPKHTDNGRGGSKSLLGCRRKLSPPDSPSTQLSETGGSNVVGPRPRMCKNISKELTDASHFGNGEAGKSHHARSSKNPVRRTSTAARKVERGGRQGTNSKNNECFSAPTESFLQDFDFESNLALFNKQAVFKEIENGFPDLSIQANSSREQKYRHDENVLQPGESTGNKPALRQQIKVPGGKSELYYTDNGLVVPSVSAELRDKLCDAAAQCGLSHARQLEAFGRAASEMVIHLIGGSHRIQPKNDHQMPVVVVLCGPHTNGALGACCARILGSHGVQATVLLPCSDRLPPSLAEELELCKMNGGSVVNQVNDLPSTIDLVVSALDCPSGPYNGQAWTNPVVHWLSSGNVRAQVLALDPPASGPSVPAKWSLFKVLPLASVSPTCGHVYLCDLCIPVAVYVKVGIKYCSPFGSKFVIPLHLQG